MVSGRVVANQCPCRQRFSPIASGITQCQELTVSVRFSTSRIERLCASVWVPVDKALAAVESAHHHAGGQRPSLPHLEKTFIHGSAAAPVDRARKPANLDG